MQGGNVLVDGAKSLVTAGNGATGAFNVAATGTDSTSATGYALTVSNLGQVLAQQTGDLNLYAAPGSSVLVTTQGRVSAANTGSLWVGDGNGGIVDATNASLRVDVTSGGVIEKTAGTDTSIIGNTILVDGVVGGANSTISTSTNVIGDFSVEATGGNTSSQPAITISNGGQLYGANQGKMTVLANNGSISVSGGYALQDYNQGVLNINSPSLLVAGSGTGSTTPTIVFNNAGVALIQANTITGSENSGALVNVSNLGNLVITPFNANTLTIDPISIIKYNSPGDIILAATNINLTDAVIGISSGTLLNGGNIILAGNSNGNVNLPATTLVMIDSIIRNKGTGNQGTTNNIQFSVANFQMSNSVVQTQTNAGGQGGNVSIVNGSQLNTKITFGLSLNDSDTFTAGGTADWKVVSLLEPDLTLSPLGVSYFAATSEYKLSENIRLSATDSVQAAVRGIISQWNLLGREADLRNNPCEREGSSLSRNGSGGYAVASSMTLPLPVSYGSVSGHMPYTVKGTAGFGLEYPIKLAALNRTPDRECN